MRTDAVAVLLVIVMLILPVPLSHGSMATASLYVIERDTIQTRNFIPIVNHEILLINLSQQPLSMNVRSAIPPGKFVKGQFYPAFLNDSLLPDPMFSPIEFTPEKTSYLPKPEIETSGSYTVMTWKDVAIHAREAAIAQYDNYFGEPSLYWTADGLNIVGLRIQTTYAVETRGNERVLIFKYELENAAGNPIDDLAFVTFIPVTIHTADRDTSLIELNEIASSPNVRTYQETRVDGFGRAASGISATLFSESLPSHDKIRFVLKLTGSLTTTNDTMWPIITLRGRCITKPVWPSAEITLTEQADIERFTYLSYNLALQDSWVLKFSDRNVTILPAAE